jgi:selT/selW/selH-like putative selenoprotein
VTARLEVGDSGEFTVAVDGKRVFSKRDAGRFPEPDEILLRLGDG